LNLFLIETEEDVHNFKNEIEECNEKDIVAMTTLAHKILKKKDISHQVIDEFFLDSDYDNIDNIMTNFSLNWYKQKDVQLESGGINLGYLLETEIIHYFLSITRNVIGIQKILENKNPTSVFVGNLGDITKTLLYNKDTSIVEKKSTQKLKLDREEIEIPLPLARTRKIRISRKQFNKTKNFLEKFSSKSIKENNSSEKAILLLDFNPVFYKGLLKKFSEEFDRVYLLNQRRPAIWNFESRKIVKQYQCEILRLDDFNTSETKNEINEQTNSIKSKIMKLNSNENLEKFFKINDISIWNIMKNEFTGILLERSEEMIRRKVLVEQIFDAFTFSAIFEWAYKGFEERIVNYKACLMNIPITFLQHSIIVENSKFDVFLPFQPTLPDNKSKVAVYGDNSYDFIMEKGISEKQIIKTGSPRHEEFFLAREDAKQNESVVIATASTFPKYKADGNDIRSYDRLEEIIKKTLEILKKYPEKKPTIKLHPRKDYDDITSYIRDLDENIAIYRDQKSIDVIKNCEMLISTNFSTILLEAMILEKPTIMISNKNFENESIVKSGATVFVSNINEIEEAIDRIILDKEFRKQLIINGNKYVERYFSHQNDASKYLAKELRSIS